MQVMKLFEILLKHSEEGKECDLGAELMTMTNNIICRMTMSTRCSASANESVDIRDFINEIANCAAKMSLGEVWGPLKKLDLLGYGRKLRECLWKFDRLVEKVMKEHEKDREGGERERRDMLDLLLGICEDEKADVKLTRDNIKCFLLVSFPLSSSLLDILHIDARAMCLSLIISDGRSDQLSCTSTN